MEIISFDSPAYKSLDEKMDMMLALYLETTGELKRLKDNRLMGINEAMAYIGYGKSWLLAHKEDIGYHQIEGGPIKFYKDDLDKYFSKYKIQRKF